MINKNLKNLIILVFLGLLVFVACQNNVNENPVNEKPENNNIINIDNLEKSEIIINPEPENYLENLIFSYMFTQDIPFAEFQGTVNELNARTEGNDIYLKHYLDYACCADLSAEAKLKEENEIHIIYTNKGEICRRKCVYLVEMKIENLKARGYIIKIFGINDLQNPNNEISELASTFIEVKESSSIIEQRNENEEFCGISTNDYCEDDSDCIVSGCSGEVCGSSNENIASICIWKDCYKNSEYSCKCINNQCQWSKNKNNDKFIALPNMYYCEDREDCTLVGCGCKCSGCGGVSYDEAINKDYVNQWYKLNNCKPATEKDVCPMVCCPRVEVDCIDNRCVAIEEKGLRTILQ
ncbi:MAG: eight-cysteine-cluster domain-containing protein [Candidatus Woesearchaeota archaeon]